MTPKRIPSADGKTGKPTDSTRSSRIADLLTPEHKRNLDPGFAPTSLNLRLFGPALNVISLPLLLPVSPVPWSGALDWGEGGGGRCRHPAFPPTIHGPRCHGGLPSLWD
ncbi:hypothetical protein FKM82_017173 [Ascaphus truei]